MTAAWGTRTPDGVVRWARWSAWLTTALVALQLLTDTGHVAGVPGTHAVQVASMVLPAVVALVLAIRGIGLRKRLFPDRTRTQASREAAAGRGRLLRGGPFAAPDERERLAWWALASDSQALWFGAFGVGTVSLSMLDGHPGLLLTGLYVLGLVALVLAVTAFAQVLRNFVRLCRAVESMRASGTLEP